LAEGKSKILTFEKNPAMKMLPLIPFLLALFLSGCALFSPKKTDYSEAQNNQSDTAVYQIVEVLAQYPGGEEALMRYLANNVVYPQKAIDANIQGTVIMEFVVEKDGRITNVKVRKGAHPLLDKEAERVLSAMTAWKPGTQNRKPVRSIFIIPIRFQLPK
jgi:periplasmic protein TonB